MASPSIARQCELLGLARSSYSYEPLAKRVFLVMCCLDTGDHHRSLRIYGEVPVATRDIERRKNQEEGCPSVGAVREAHDARGGRDTGTENTRDPRDAEVAVLPWVDQSVQPRSRGREPPPAQTFRTGVAVGCVHRDTPCRAWCRPPDHLLM